MRKWTASAKLGRDAFGAVYESPARQGRLASTNATGGRRLGRWLPIARDTWADATTPHTA